MSPEHAISDTSADLSRKELSNTHTNSYQQVHDHSVTDSQHALYKVSEPLELVPVERIPHRLLGEPMLPSTSSRVQWKLT